MTNGKYTIEVEIKDWEAAFAICESGENFPLKLGVVKAGFGADYEAFVNEIVQGIGQKLVEIVKGEK